MSKDVSMYVWFPNQKTILPQKNVFIPYNLHNYMPFNHKIINSHAKHGGNEHSKCT